MRHFLSKARARAGFIYGKLALAACMLIAGIVPVFAQSGVVEAGDPAPVLNDFATKVGAAFLLVFAIALGLAVIAFVWRRSRQLQAGK